LAGAFETIQKLWIYPSWLRHSESIVYTELLLIKFQKGDEIYGKNSLKFMENRKMSPFVWICLFTLYSRTERKAYNKNKDRRDEIYETHRRIQFTVP
jgi:hypothetical protein